MQVYSFILFVLLMGSAKSERYISGNAFKSIADHVHDETGSIINPKCVKCGDIIFLKTDYMQDFFENLLPLIENQFILITHNSDYGAPGNFEKYLDNTKIIKMFSQNPTVVHTKLVPIPIGIANSVWEHGNEEHFNNVLKILPNYKKRHLVGLNFEISTYPDTRSKVYNKFVSKSYCKKTYSKNHESYLLNMAECEYTLSPRGNGLDCHRTWEAMIVGSIPIVETSPLDSVYEDMPVLIINRWEDVTLKMLHEKKDALSSKKNSPKIYFDYWAKLILSEKNKALNLFN